LPFVTPSRKAVKDAIRASGKKVTDYSVRELHQAAEAMINPALVERAKESIARWFETRRFCCAIPGGGSGSLSGKLLQPHKLLISLTQQLRRKNLAPFSTTFCQRCACRMRRFWTQLLSQTCGANGRYDSRLHHKPSSKVQARPAGRRLRIVRNMFVPPSCRASRLGRIDTVPERGRGRSRE